MIAFMLIACLWILFAVLLYSLFMCLLFESVTSYLTKLIPHDLRKKKRNAHFFLRCHISNYHSKPAIKTKQLLSPCFFYRPVQPRSQRLSHSSSTDAHDYSTTYSSTNRSPNWWAHPAESVEPAAAGAASALTQTGTPTIFNSCFSYCVSYVLCQFLCGCSQMSTEGWSNQLKIERLNNDWLMSFTWWFLWSLMLQEQVTAAIALAVEQQTQKLLVETQLDITEFDNLLQPIIDTCTKDAISVSLASGICRFLLLERKYILICFSLRLERIGCSTTPSLHTTVNWWPHTCATASPLKGLILSSACISFT